MSLPKLTSTKEINETWIVPNIRQYINQIKVKRADRYHLQPTFSDSLITSHVFNMGIHSGIEGKDCFRAQANLAQHNSDVVLTVSLQDNRQARHWAISVKFMSVSYYMVAEGKFHVFTNPSRSNYAYEESNLRTSDCTASLFPTGSAENYIISNMNSMIIRFSLTCKFTKPRMSVSPELELSVAKKTDFQKCESEALNDYKALLKDTAAADVKIITTIQECRFFDCHKSILAARSPVLRAMFETTMKETQENVVTVEDISAETMEHLLDFIYCGRFQKDSWIKYLPQLTNAAEKYCVSSLKQLCDTNLIKSVTCENALAIADLAQRHQLPNAILDIRKFIEKNARNINLDIASATKALDI